MMDADRKKKIIAGLVIAILEDVVEGEPNNWPAVLKGADELYDGGFVTERIADFVASHFKDAYADSVKIGHARLAAMRLEGLST